MSYELLAALVISAVVAFLVIALIQKDFQISKLKHELHQLQFEQDNRQWLQEALADGTIKIHAPVSETPEENGE